MLSFSNFAEKTLKESTGKEENNRCHWLIMVKVKNKSVARVGAKCKYSSFSSPSAVLRWMHGCMDAWIDGWMDGWMAGYAVIAVYTFSFS